MKTVFEANVINTWQEAGKDWLASLPSLIATLEQQWNLTNLQVIPSPLSYNYVMTGLYAGQPIVLKLGCDKEAIARERIALQAYNGNGAVIVYAYDLQLGALLLEQIEPGITLQALFPGRDDEAVACAAQSMQRLHAVPVSVVSELPTLQEQLHALYATHEDAYHIRKAQSIAQELLTNQQSPVLLHGDLHHANLLQSRRGWLAIDPHGIIGDPAYDVVAFVRNPYPDVIKSKALIERRLSLFAEYLKIDKQRLQAWLYVQAVLNACWSLQEGRADRGNLFVQAEYLESMM